MAHQRGTPCIYDDLPAADGRQPDDVAFANLDDDQYARALPLLRQHVPYCGAGDGDLLAVDDNLFGYDSAADVVVVAKPDLLRRRDRTLIVREVKTTTKALPTDEAIARDQFDDVVYWFMSLLVGGWITYYGCDDAQVELEILRADSAALFTFRSTDEDVTDIAQLRMDERVTDWHTDTTWPARPGPVCSFCPVAQWCPDRAAPGDPATRAAPDDDLPPF
jgi:hypothetical protein